MADPTTNIANRKRMVIQFFHAPTGRKVEFKAFLTQYADKFESEWNSEPVYGRMDPLETFQGTKRVISLGWSVPSYDFADARLNLNKASLLMSMLYPAYDAEGGAGAISAAPLFKLKFVNLIAQGGFHGIGDDVATSGLVGRVGGFSYEPDLDSGFFVPDEVKGLNAKNALYPQTINLSCEFTVFHTHKLGWQAGGDAWRTDTDAGAIGGYPFPETTYPENENKRTQETSPRTEAQKKAAADRILNTPQGTFGRD